MKIIAMAKRRAARASAACGLARALLAGAALGPGAASVQAREVVAVDVGCVEWSAAEGCTRVMFSYLYSDRTYMVTYFSPSMALFM